MRITFIGAGNLATHLSKALIHSGHTIAQVYSHTYANAELLGQLVSAEPVCDIADIRGGADVYIFAVKDAVLESLSQELYKRLSATETPLFIHTAGSMSIDTLPAPRRGVLYPMQTFSKSREVDFGIIPVFIEAKTSDDMAVVRALAESVSTKVYEMSSDDRKYLHLSAVFFCNFANHCYRLGESVLAQHQIPFDVMLPLIDETARKVHVLSPHQAQTGPAVRWDSNVIDRHIHLLEGLDDMQSIYKLLSQSIHNDQL